MSILLAQARLGTWVTNQPALPKTRSCNLKLSQMCWFDLFFSFKITILFFLEAGHSAALQFSFSNDVKWVFTVWVWLPRIFPLYLSRYFFASTFFIRFTLYSKLVSLKRKLQGRNVQNHGVLRACTIRLPQSTPEFDSFILFYSFGLEQVEILYIVGTLNPIWMELGLWSWATI